MMIFRTSIVLLAFLTVAQASAEKSRPPTGAERICINRCEAKGWPPRCLEECMRRWR
jgi:hypothetical protein